MPQSTLAGVLRHVLPEADAGHSVLLPGLQSGNLLQKALSPRPPLFGWLRHCLLPETLPGPLPSACRRRFCLRTGHLPAYRTDHMRKYILLQPGVGEFERTDREYGNKSGAVAAAPTALNF